jgi:predicted TIM-barrel fold metal-dependent hydrolase
VTPDPAPTAESTTAALAGHQPVRADWLARHSEAPLAPDQEIVDAHHHFFSGGDWRYLTDELTADIAQAPGLSATVFVECGEHHRPAGPAAVRPVGETEFVRDLTPVASAGRVRLAAAIVGTADLRAPTADAVLHAHLDAGDGRFRGIRQSIAWDPDPAVTHPRRQPPPGLYAAAEFRRGFRRLAPLALTFDAWCFHPQIPDVTDLARAFPGTRIVLDHCGGPLGVGGHAGPEAFRTWRAHLAELARCDNVVVKIGGLGMTAIGHRFFAEASPPTSTRLAATLRPWVHSVIELFGAHRCMFESNFPVDKASYAYGVFWNACTRLAEEAGADERAALFADTARDFYRLP